MPARDALRLYAALNARGARPLLDGSDPAPSVGNALPSARYVDKLMQQASAP